MIYAARLEACMKTGKDYFFELCTGTQITGQISDVKTDAVTLTGISRYVPVARESASYSGFRFRELTISLDAIATIGEL